MRTATFEITSVLFRLESIILNTTYMFNNTLIYVVWQIVQIMRTGSVGCLLTDILSIKIRTI